jgi:hypothetical protein
MPDITELPMGDTEGTILLTRDESTGHVHKRVVLGDGLASLEVDNLDQAGTFVVIGRMDEITLADLDPKVLCRHCFVRAAG